MSTKIQIARTEEPQLRPNAIQLENGQPVINYNEAEPGLYFKLRDNTLCKIGPTHVGPNPPNSSALGWPGNSIGELWLETRGNVTALHIWTGTEWSRDADVSTDTDQTITGVKTFTQVINAESGINATGQDIFADSILLSGTITGAETTIGMANNILASKGYVDSRSSSATLSNSLVAGDFLEGDDFDGSAPVTWKVSSDAQATPNTLVVRDLQGAIEAETVKALDAIEVGSDQVVIKSDGKGLFKVGVGIGETIFPQSLLELKPATNTHQLQLTESSSNDGWRLHGDDSNGGLLNLTRHESGADEVKLTVLSDGSVGIGTENPSTKLEVAGNITADNITTFKDNLNTNIATATTIAQIKTAIINALALL